MIDRQALSKLRGLSREQLVQVVEKNPEIKKLLIPRLNKYIPWMPTLKQMVFLCLDNEEVFYGGAAGGAKLLGIHTPIFTFNKGWSTIGKLEIGDKVFNEEGKPVDVIWKSEICNDNCYKIKFVDGEEIIAHAGHLWNVLTEKDRQSYFRASPEFKAKRRANRPSRAKLPKDRVKSGRGSSKGNRESSVLSNSKRAFEARQNLPLPNVWDFSRKVETKDLLSLMKSERQKLTVPVMSPILNGGGNWKSKVSPYIMGFWLGDGCKCGAGITQGKDDQIELLTQFKNEGLHCYRIDADKTYYFKDAEGRTLSFLLKDTFGPTKTRKKHIPDWIYSASYMDRREFIAGLIDSDGHVRDDGGIVFNMADKDLIEGIHSILCSLGLRASKICHQITKCQNGFVGESWRFHVTTNEPMCRYKRKLEKIEAKPKSKGRREFRYIESVEKCIDVPTQCIQVANSRGLFAIGRSFLITHNSVALMMAALQFVDLPGYNAILIRDKYTNLNQPNGLIPLAHEWLRNTDAKWKDGNHYVFPGGATLSFGYLDGPLDHFNYLSSQYQFVGIDEVVGVRENQAMYLFSRMRKSDRSAQVPLRFRCASNPPAREQLARGSWVKRRYVDPETRVKGAIYLPSRIEDNPHLNAHEYKTKSLSKLDPVTRKQLEEGDWNIRVTGRMFQRHWFQLIDSAPKNNIKWVRYWDFAGTEEKATSNSSDDPDFTAGAKVGMTPDGLFFIDNIVAGQWSPLQVELTVKQTAAMDGTDVKIKIEEEPGASGKHLVDYYRRQVLRGFTVRGDKKNKSKVSTWGLLANKAEAGDVFMVRGEWNKAFLDEIELVPDGLHDDRTDAVAGAVQDLAGLGVKVVPRIGSVKEIEKGIERFVKKPEIGPGEQLVEVWEQDRVVAYEVVGGTKYKPRTSLCKGLRFR